ncbi:MAG: hypothetical protein U1F29_02655 [Planctomycetota bacterium]
MKSVFFVSFRAHAFAMPKSITFGTDAVVHRHQHVRRLEVAWITPCDARAGPPAHAREEPEALAQAELRLVAILRDRHALDELHRRSTARRGRAAVEHLRDVRVLHERQRLALRLEPHDDLARVHAELDDLERDLVHDGLALFRPSTVPIPPSPIGWSSL